MGYVLNYKLYRDSGYTRGSFIVPKYPPAPIGDVVIEGGELHPPTSSMFTSLRIPHDYSSLIGVSYAEIEFRLTDSIRKFYFWVTDMEMISDTEKPITQLTLEMDLWMTYLTSCTFSYGLVERRSREADDPIQNVSYRYRIAGPFTSLSYRGVGEGVVWAIINYVRQTSDNKITETATMCFPVERGNPDNHYSLKFGATQYECIPLSDLIVGDWDEKLGLSPTTVSSVFISPIPPFDIESFADGVITIRSAPTPGSNTEYISLERSYDDIRHGVISTFLFSLPCEVFVELSDGSRQTRSIEANGDAFNDYLLNTHRAPLYNEGSTTMSVRVDVHLTDVEEVTEDHDQVGFLAVYRLDDYIKQAIGEETWNTLSLGDRVAFRSTDYVHLVHTYTASTAFTFGSHGNANVHMSLSAELRTTLTGELFVFSYAPSVGGFETDPTWVIITSPWKSLPTVPSFKLTFKRTALSYDVELDQHTYDGHAYGFMHSRTGSYFEHRQSLDSEIMTTDTTELIATDLEGSPIATLPWGITLKDYTVRNMISQTSCYIEYRFHGLNSHVTGTCVAIPIPTVDITSNSWSDYVYSGQRDYDKTQRQIASEQALVQGIASSITGGVSNSIFAGIGATKSPIAIGAASMGIGALTSVAQYGISLWHNDRLQSAEDQLQAKQLDSIIAPSGGWDWLYHGREIGIVAMTPDNYSVERFNDDVRWNGIKCSEPTGDCTNLIKAGGPLKITNLEIHGSAPPEAKEYIKQRFADGVCLK